MAYTFKHGDRPVDGYTIQRAVGKGGFGEVYYAISDGGREVAVKYLRDNPQVELRGVSHCINLKSPHLVSIFDVKTTVDGEYAIIMEYCSGPSLRDLLLAEPNGFGPQKAAFFVREIAKGLAYLHDRGIVHRDLKPGNLFYDDGYVKIGDYGLSKFISVSRHSAQTASVGTVHYMAPEIGSGNYSRGVDIYALGVILYEMLLGKVPFEGSTMAEVLMKHLTAQPELDQLPQPFGRIIRKALQKDPNDRYQDVNEMVDELLAEEEVKASLAGFSTKSLEGAVKLGAQGRTDSPVPSPNPGRPWDVNPPLRRHQPHHDAMNVARDEMNQSPAAGRRFTLDANVPPGLLLLRNRIAKRFDRVFRKMDDKLAKLEARSSRRRRVNRNRGHRGNPSAPRGEDGAFTGSMPFSPVDRRKRILLSVLLSIGLAVGLGILVANTFSPRRLASDMGVAASLLILSMAGSVRLSRVAVRWFGAAYGPKWSQRLIALCCCTPLMAIGATPVLYESRGMGLWLGLLFVAVFANWDKETRKAGSGEMSFGTAIWTASCALICTAIAIGIVGGHGHSVENTAMVGAAIAGVVSLIIQATTWWLPATTGREQSPPARGFSQRRPVSEERAAELSPHGASRSMNPVNRDAGPPPPPYAQTAPGTPDPGLREAPNKYVRWGITRAFWGLIAFVLMGGAIVTFLIPLIAQNFHYHDITLSVSLCTGFASFMVFALRKTTPLKRDGFWRETLGPFLISLMMFGMGGTITGIAREWSHVGSTYYRYVDGAYTKYLGPCLPDEGRVALIAGLVLCSFMFPVLLVLTIRRRRPPRPFLQADYDGGEGDGPETLDEEIPPPTPSESIA